MNNKLSAAADVLAVDVAVIGAGMAGLTAAKTLHEQGLRVVVLEKARGSGGRLSSKRMTLSGTNEAKNYATSDTQETLTFDLGASAFHVTDENFLQALEPLITAGHAANWPQAESTDDPSVKQPAPKSFVGLNRNSALTRQLATGLDVRFATRVVQLEKTDQGWQLWRQTEQGHEAFVLTKQVVLATPPEQALALIPEQYELDLQAQLQRAYVAPQWVLGWATDTEPLASLPSIQAWDDHPILAQVSLEHSKPQRQSMACLQVQANAAWSEQHKDDDPQQVAAILMAETQAQLGLTLPVHAHHVHRWLYSYSETPLGQAFGLGESGLHACGDYWLALHKQEGVQCAYLSGRALAQALL